jgi:hypothetical protein
MPNVASNPGFIEDFIINPSAFASNAWARYTGLSYNISTITLIFGQLCLIMFFPLENRTLFRLKIAHLFATITHKLPLGNHSLQSIQEEQKGDSNGRLGNN